MYLWLWLAFTALAGATDVGKLLSVLIEVINNMSTSTSTKSSIIIFTNTCKRCHEISEILNQMNIYNVILIYIYIL